MWIYLVNESTLLSDSDAQTIAVALNVQAQRDFRAWRSDVHCVFAPGGVRAVIPGGGAILHLVDTMDQPGALGYHDETGALIPYGRVGVRTAQQNGQEVSEVCSHEMLEIAADPHVNLTAPTGSLSRLYALEVGDPVQGNAYPISLAGGHSVMVADFILPRWADPRTPADVPTDFRGVIRGPFALAPQGYFSFVDLGNVRAGWQQQVGAEHVGPAPVDSDDRVARRAGISPSSIEEEHNEH